jgi:hypothetical protein
MRRINSNAFADQPTRQFNTSRSSKAIGDTSTVDLVYMPIMSDMENHISRPTQIPVLPDLYSHHESTSSSDPPMKPQIYTVSDAAGVVAASAMSEVVDNHSIDIDPFSLTEAVSRSRVGQEVQRQVNGKSSETGVLRELWTGFLDDVMGPKEVARK